MSMFISGSSTSTGSFAHIRGGGGTTTDNQNSVSFEISSRKKYASNATFDISLVDGDTRTQVFSALSASGGYYSYIGNNANGYSFGYLGGWTGKLYMQSEHILTRNAGGNQP